MLLVVFWGLTSAVFLAVEIMCNKWMMIARDVSGDIAGICFLLIDGIIGTTCLYFATEKGQGLHEMTTVSFSMIMIAGVLAFTAIVIMNYSISIGLAGVAISLFNTNGPI